MYYGRYCHMENVHDGHTLKRKGSLHVQLRCTIGRHTPLRRYRMHDGTLRITDESEQF